MLREVGGKEIFVTGAGGFIGSAVVAALLRLGARVRALAGAPDDAIRDLPREVTATRGEITDEAAVSELMAGAEVVIHLAGPPSVAESFDRPVEYARVHVAGTAAVLAACRRLNVRRLIYISSAEVYGQPRTIPVAEDQPLQARSPYAAAKIGAEKLVESFAHAFAMEAIILRPFSVYGEGLSSASLIATIVRQARQSDRVRLASLKPVRDYCYVEDLAAAIVRACAVECASPDVFNIGSGCGTSVGEVANLILRIIGRAVPVVEEAAAQRPGRSEINCLIADTRKAQAKLGWTPAYSLERGLAETIKKARRA
ncbi:MAG TPA: NAD-dependent epimerase/dehydratase family protein [Blastocatellia bacterium]|nr:NAD-dependent epimerase/dehydratase family protein [Blastocatellia bacterium]